MTNASKKRVRAFVDWFIRTEYADNWSSEHSNDFLNAPERAERCYKAAENGADGSTHAEQIEDWREALEGWLSDYHWNYWRTGELFMDAVRAYFDELAAWHEKNGSLNQEIG